MTSNNRIYISTSCIKGKTSYEIAIKQLLDAKIFNIEISGNHFHKKTSEIVTLIKKYSKLGVNFIFHNYFPSPKDEFVLNYLSQNSELRHQSFDVINEAIKISKLTNVNLYTFHPGYYRDAKIGKSGNFIFYDKKNTYKESFDLLIKNLEVFNKNLNQCNQNHNICIGLENLFPNPDGTNDSFMCDYNEISNIFSSTFIKKTNIGLLIDLGHLFISSNIFNFDKYIFLDKVIESYGNKIYEVHISENDGNKDLHLRVNKNSWQLEALKMFKNTGSKSKKTIFTIESRNLTTDQMKFDMELINNQIS